MFFMTLSLTAALFRISRCGVRQNLQFEPYLHWGLFNFASTLLLGNFTNNSVEVM